MTSFDTWPPISIAGTGSSTSGDAAADAARAALDAGEVHGDDINLLVVIAPRTAHGLTRAPELHDALGLRPESAALDLRGGSSGFIGGLHAAASMLAGGEAWTNALLVAADPAQGAGAVVLRKELEVADVIAMAAADAGLDPGGSFADGIDGGPLDEATAGMRAVSFATHAGGQDDELGALVDAVTAACRDALVELDELAAVVPHQSGRAQLQQLVDQLALPEGRIVIDDAHDPAATPSSMPQTLDLAVRAGRITAGDLVCLVGADAEQTAACVLRWA